MTINDDDNSKKEISYLPRSYGAGRPVKPNKEHDDSVDEDLDVSAGLPPVEDDSDDRSAPPELVALSYSHEEVQEQAPVEEVIESPAEESFAAESLPAAEEVSAMDVSTTVDEGPTEEDESAEEEADPDVEEDLAVEEDSGADEDDEPEESPEDETDDLDYDDEPPEESANDEEPAKLIVSPPEEPPPPGKEPLKVIVNLVGIRFDYAGKIYHFDAEDLKLEMDEWVIVRTEKGIGLGRVALPSAPREVEASRLDGLRKVMRRAGKVDFERTKACRRKEREAYLYCLERIEDLGLPMKLVSVECFFDGSKYVFYFTAEGRVDFRELVKQLVARYPVRIEMRQIGVRHESKMTGGLACCGQELCCSRFLTEFRPVSVKMAKNQNLSLNPSKISGVCGRLMCCLGYEHEIYENFKRGLPKVGKPVTTSKGCGVMVKHNPLTETTLIRLEDESTIEVRKEDIHGEAATAPKKNGQKAQSGRKGKRSEKKKARDPQQD